MDKKFEIPNNNKDLKIDIEKNKRKYMDHVYSIFKEISTDEIPERVRIFSFNNTNLEVIIKKPSYLPNLQNLLDYYSNIEEYELCNVIKNIINKINNENKD